MDLKVFDWDRHNLKKIRAHDLTREETEEAVLNDPLVALVYEVGGELRTTLYSETNAARIIAVVVTDRNETLRVVTAYDLSARQRRHYLQMRSEEG